MDSNDVAALLESAKLPEATVQLCLRGDLQAEWETLERKLSEAKQRGDRRLTGSAEEAALARQMRELEQQMESSTLTVLLRALPRKPWRKLVESHPPRKGNDADRMLGLDSSTFFDDLVAQCIVEPVLDAGQLEALLDKLTDAQFGKLSDAAWGLNRRDVNVPFSRTASRITTNSDGT
ncbi:hypothetical protein B1813_19015 [Saccharomonospora piscinae]|uniref:Uncharacterized protein n=1 Tax=Saccharomonospora piscinae TaxID=687388 RepID=A0A1V8ZYH8_SACPI|nr:hypothetical protein [Saccharomonospora piscinae]OQO89932.1 hypothetical protein B1813_19015 [Saccharomonospora piscinae]